MKQSQFTFSFTLLVPICETNRFPAESFSHVHFWALLQSRSCGGIISIPASQHNCCIYPAVYKRLEGPALFLSMWFYGILLGPWAGRKHNTKRRFLVWVTLFRHLKIWGHQAGLGQLFGKKQYLYQQKGNEAETERVFLETELSWQISWETAKAGIETCVCWTLSKLHNL